MINYSGPKTIRVNVLELQKIANILGVNAFPVRYPASPSGVFLEMDVFTVRADFKPNLNRYTFSVSQCGYWWTSFDCVESVIKYIKNQ